MKLSVLILVFSFMERPVTRSRILECGTDLLSASGLSGITLGLLAEQAGMSKSGLFAHFGSKEELQLGLLEHTAALAGQHVMGPAMRSLEGLPRLKDLVHNWLGWSTKAGLSGGCPVAAGMFELDDCDGPVRERLLQMEADWRGVLANHTARAIELGHLRRNTDIDQFVWELCGIYLSHHTSARFVKDPKADYYARIALNALLKRASPISRAVTNGNLVPRTSRRASKQRPAARAGRVDR